MVCFWDWFSANSYLFLTSRVRLSFVNLSIWANAYLTSDYDSLIWYSVSAYSYSSTVVCLELNSCKFSSNCDCNLSDTDLIINSDWLAGNCTFEAFFYSYCIIWSILISFDYIYSKYSLLSLLIRSISSLNYLLDSSNTNTCISFYPISFSLSCDCSCRESTVYSSLSMCYCWSSFN